MDSLGFVEVETPVLQVCGFLLYLLNFFFAGEVLVGNLLVI